MSDEDFYTLLQDHICRQALAEKAPVIDAGVCSLPPLESLLSELDGEAYKYAPLTQRCAPMGPRHGLRRVWRQKLARVRRHVRKLH